MKKNIDLQAKKINFISIEKLIIKVLIASFILLTSSSIKVFFQTRKYSYMRLAQERLAWW
jgi:hypothetical protein